MTEPFEILVVCLGNVCRSPLAERVLRLRLEEQAVRVHVSSAGVRALVGASMDETAATELVRLGGDPAGFASRQLVEQMAVQADLVLTATQELRSRTLEIAPRALRRTFTIRELADLIEATDLPDDAEPAELVALLASRRGTVEALDVPDPIGQPTEVHREVADLLDRCCAVIVAAIGRALSPHVDTTD